MAPTKVQICCPETIDSQKIKNVLQGRLKTEYGVTLTLTLGIIVDAIENSCKNLNWSAEIDGYFVKSNFDTALFTCTGDANISAQKDLFYGSNSWMGTNKFYQKFTLRLSSDDLKQPDDWRNLKCSNLVDLDHKINIVLSLSLLNDKPARAPASEPASETASAPANASAVVPQIAPSVLNQKPFMIFIKTLEDTTIVLQVTSAMTITELKQLIENKENIPSWQQRLIYVGRLIEDCATIGSMNIQREATIYLVLGMQEGAQYISSLQVDYCSLMIKFDATVDKTASILAEQIKINFLKNGKEKLLIAFWIHPKCKIDTVHKIIRLECDQRYFSRLTRVERRDIASVAPMLSRETLTRLCLEMSNN